ncbi:MAG: porin family protein [Candidatus Aminicenantes bacterium]|nr:porin family protein [Candidatus Aminicenantes bacterium]
MRKKILLIAVLLLCSRAASGQVLISLLFGDKLNTGKIEFGLDGGMTLTRTDGLDPSGTLTTWNLGFYFDIKLKDPAWMVHTGVIVKSTLGADHMPVYSLNDPGLDEEFSGGSVTRKLNYFNVPIMIKYRTKSQIFVEGGVQLGLLHKAADTFYGLEVPDGGDLSYKLDIMDRYYRLDAGLIVGFGYRLLGGNGMNIGVRYYHGLADVVKDDSTPGQFNRAVYLTVGIPIGAGKAAKKSEAAAK